MPRKTRIQLRRDTAANWTATNPTLASAEIGYETDTNKLKIGDGATAWNALGYFAGSGGGGITTITSTGGSIGITAATGPTTNLDLPASGVTPGTYGDATHSVTATVAADGIITALSAVPISGGAANLTVLFDSTLSSPAASIDTGAGGIAGGHNTLIAVVLAQTTAAAATDPLLVTLNNDSGANYDEVHISGTTTSASVNNTSAGNNMQVLGHGAGGSANYPTANVFIIPSYASTTFWKAINCVSSRPDATAANKTVQILSFGWRSTAAISRMAVAPTTGPNLATGSRLTVFGLG